jgi:hypothetical protein
VKNLNKSNKAIGGFFELEIETKKEYHKTHYKYNCARNALVSLIQAKKISKIFIPAYICESIINGLKKNNIDFSLYSINNIVSPFCDEKVKENEAILLVNYFDIVDITSVIPIDDNRTYIIDNSQAFFRMPVKNFDTFYSPRKFFGIPDGAYLYTNFDFKDEYDLLPENYSYGLCKHLINRIEFGPENSYPFFKETQNLFKEGAISKMSALSNHLLTSFNYERLKSKRLNNFKFLNDKFFDINKLTINSYNVPLCYPLLIEGGKFIREELIKKKIFVPQYWSFVLNLNQSYKYEKMIAENLVCLPIDHRYDTTDMEYIYRTCRELLVS